MKYLQAKTKTFVRKVYGRIYRYLYYDESLMLNKLERFRHWNIGDHTYGHPTGSPKVLYFGEDASLTIGKYCAFAEDVWIMLGGNHRTDWITTYPFNVLWKDERSFPGHPSSKGDITFGHDVWVCTGATILSGVTIGNGAVIATRSVVTKDVPPYAIVAGNPARVVRMRFNSDQIDALNKIRWWDWSEEKISAELPALLSGDIAGFVEMHAAAKL